MGASSGGWLDTSQKDWDPGLLKYNRPELLCVGCGGICLIIVPNMMSFKVGVLFFS